jgi:hypothetical protein
MQSALLRNTRMVVIEPRVFDLGTYDLLSLVRSEHPDVRSYARILGPAQVVVVGGTQAYVVVTVEES